jgi:hypothetical protein
MLRHHDILQGARFVWLTDHKGLVHLLNQRNLSGRQARWIEKIGKFDFEVRYLPGVENLLPDALSRMYAFDAPGTVRMPSEYTEHDTGNLFAKVAHLTSMPLLVGDEALATDPRQSTRVAQRMVATQTQQPQPVPRGAVKMTWGAKPKAPAQPTPAPPVPRAQPALAPAAPTPGPSKARKMRQPVAPAETGRSETGTEFAR